MILIECTVFRSSASTAFNVSRWIGYLIDVFQIMRVLSGPDDQALLDLLSLAAEPPGSVSMADPRYQQAGIDRSLFPILDLPRLRKLGLHDLAALRFDFESLQSMQQLEYLEMCVSKKTATWYSTSEFMTQQKSAWKNKYHANLKSGDVSHGNGGDHGNNHDNNSNNRNTHPSGDKGSCGTLWEWSLPRLKSLVLDGPLATMFFLEWLRGSPSLEVLSLTTRGLYQHTTRKPFFALSSSTLSPPSSLSPILREFQTRQQDPMANQNPLYSKEPSDDPLMHSRLAKIVLSGPWVMSDNDLLSLLTIHAPFLEQFMVDRLHERTSLSGYQFLKVILEADQVNRDHAESLLAANQDQEPVHDNNTDDHHDTDDQTNLTTSVSDTESALGSTSNPDAMVDSADNNASEQKKQLRPPPKMPGSALMLVSGKLTLNKRERPMLGMVMIEKTETSIYQTNHLRVYSLMNQYLVRQEDYDLMRERTASQDTSHHN